MPFPEFIPKVNGVVPATVDKMVEVYGKLLKCTDCDLVEREWPMVTHVIERHLPEEEVPFVCTLCRAAIRTEVYAVNHLRRAHNRGNGDWRSLLCGTFRDVPREVVEMYFVELGEMEMVERYQECLEIQKRKRQPTAKRRRTDADVESVEYVEIISMDASTQTDDILLEGLIKEEISKKFGLWKN